jgi:pentatricopeptide repeat protein
MRQLRSSQDLIDMLSPQRHPATAQAEHSDPAEDIRVRMWEGIRDMDRLLRFRGNRPAAFSIALRTLSLSQQGPVKVPPLVRQRWYRAVLRRFLNAGDGQSAASIYFQMRAEKLRAPPSLLATLLLGTRTSNIPFDKTKKIVDDASEMMGELKEEHIQVVLQFFIRLSQTWQPVEEIYRNFKRLQGEGWEPSARTCAIMTQAYAQANARVTTNWWFKKGRETAKSLPDGAREEALKELYECLFTGMHHFRWSPGWSKRKRKAGGYGMTRRIRELAEDNIRPTKRIYNILIDYTGRTGRVDRAYQYYSGMRQAEPPVPADHFTFQALFKAAISLHKAPPIPGRRLFRHMVRQHQSNTNHRPSQPSTALNALSLNAALHFFMRTRDYPAATITVHSFPVCAIEPNKITFMRVWLGLLSRVKGELMAAPPREKTTWTDHLLGKIVRTGAVWDNSVAQQLMDIGWKDALEQLERRRGAKLKASENKGLRSELHLMLALLRRAILAALGRTPNRASFQEDNDAVEGAMVIARKELLPPKRAFVINPYMVGA